MSRIQQPAAAHPPLAVGDVMTRDVTSCPPEATLDAAARIMWDRDCGFVPVTEVPTGKVCGVVTDRDACMASLIHGKALSDLPVHSTMSAAVVTVRADEPLARAHALMRERQVRRLPVVDAADRLVGIVSINDLARHAGLPQAGAERREIAATLAEICRPRQLVTV